MLSTLANYAQILSVFPIFAGVGLFYYKHICHVRGCYRISWHPSFDHFGHPVCKHHHGNEGLGAGGPGQHLG